MSPNCLKYRQGRSVLDFACVKCQDQEPLTPERVQMSQQTPEKPMKAEEKERFIYLTGLGGNISGAANFTLTRAPKLPAGVT